MFGRHKFNIDEEASLFLDRWPLIKLVMRQEDDRCKAAIFWTVWVHRAARHCIVDELQQRRIVAIRDYPSTHELRL